MFCTTIVLYGVFAGVILGITDCQRLDQNCRSLMMGRVFGYTYPTSNPINVTFVVYSDTADAQVQLTDDSGTETKNVLSFGSRFLEVIFTRTISGEGLLLEANADVGVSVQYQLGEAYFNMRLLCVADTLSQHFTPGIHGYTEIGVMSLDADNNVTETHPFGDLTSSSTHNLQERETLHLPISESTISVLCSGRCVVYRHYLDTPSPVMPVQFYAADYYLKSSQTYSLFVVAVERGATASVVTVNSAIPILWPRRHVSVEFTGLVDGSARVDTLTCSTGCVALTDIGLTNNMFYSPPESTNGSFIWSTGIKWMIVFDYGLTEYRTFQDVYSLEPVSISATSSFVISSTELVSNSRSVFKYVFVDTDIGAYRISNISDTFSSAIYVHDVTDKDNFIVPLYAADQTFITTTDPVTSTTDPVTSTTNPVTSTTDPVTSTTNPVTITTARSVATTTTDPIITSQPDLCSILTGFCRNGGSCRWNAPEGVVYCQCPPGFNGEKCQNPVVNVTSIFPIRGSGPFGPKSGGTRITMMGSHLKLTGFPVVELGGFVCPLNSSSPVEIVCETAKVTNVDVIGTELPLTVRWPPEDHPLPQGILQTKYSFVYLEDPDISTVHPLRTIAGGGVDLTVTGENMDSVASPVMEMLIFSVAGQTKTLINRYLVDCELRSPTVFICPTAHLNFTEANRRRKREAESSPRYVYQGEEIEIEINFFLDGVEEFRNMSEARPQFSTLEVFIDPHFSKVEGMEIFRPYWPFDDEYIIRTGENLLDGLSESQYNVFVGKERCTEVKVYTTSISCRAPTSEPDKENDFHDHPELTVLIGRGTVNFQLGEIQYEKHLMEYRPAQIILGVALFLIILIILIVFLCCRYKRNKFRDVPRSHRDGEPLHISRPNLNSTGPPIKSTYMNYIPKAGRVDPADRYLELTDSDAPWPYIRDTSEYRQGSAVATVYSNPGANHNNVPGNYLAPSRGHNPGAYHNNIPGNHLAPSRGHNPGAYHNNVPGNHLAPSRGHNPGAYLNNVTGNHLAPSRGHNPSAYHNNVPGNHLAPSRGHNPGAYQNNVTGNHLAPSLGHNPGAYQNNVTGNHLAPWGHNSHTYYNAWLK